MLDPTIKLYDCVRITALVKPVEFVPDCFNTREARVGDVAYVIEIYENPIGYELECSAENGTTEWLRSFTPEEIKLVKVV